jgi:hypothetical protein
LKGFGDSLLSPLLAREVIMAAKEISVKKYVVRLMEDVLAVYTRPRDPDCPLVCLDETSKQLIAETRVSVVACRDASSIRFSVPASSRRFSTALTTLPSHNEWSADAVIF